MMTFAPIVLPPPEHPAWKRAEQIVTALRAKGKGNPFIIAALANAYAESAFTAVVAGDHDESFGPWQLKFSFYGMPIKFALNIDIRTEPNLARHVDAVLFALSMPANKSTLNLLDACKTGDEATRVWAEDFERASAGGAVERRAAIAPAIEVWLSKIV